MDQFPNNQNQPNQTVSDNRTVVIKNQIRSLKVWQKLTFLGLTLTLISGSSLVFLRKNQDLFKKDTAQPSIYLASQENETTSPLKQLTGFYQQKGYQTFTAKNRLLVKNGNEQGDQASLSFEVQETSENSQTALENWIKQKKRTYQNFSYSDNEPKIIDQVNFNFISFEEESITGNKYNQIFFGNKDSWLWQVNLTGNKQNSTEFKNLEKTLEEIKLGETAEAIDSKVQGAKTSSSEEKVVNLYQPAVVRIHANHCTDYKYTKDDVRYLTKTYSFCIGAMGTGFFVDAQGHLTTNGHVVKFTPEATLIFSLLSGQKNDQFYLDFLKENIFYQLAKYGFLKRHPQEGLAIVDASGEIIALGDKAVDNEIETIAKENLADFVSDPSEVESTISVLEATVEEAAAKLNAKEAEIYLQVGQTPFELTDFGQLTNQSQMTRATLVDYNYDPANIFEENPSVQYSDIALLKAEGKDFPSTVLGSIQNLSSGQPILVMGYPASGTDNNLVDQSATAQLSTTRGIVSAIKNAFGGQRKLVQTDAAISPGSSGGPAFNLDGQVIGIATYGITGENFNYLVDVKDLKDIMVKNNIKNSRGSIDQEWFTALSLIEEQKYKKALPYLETIKQEYPQHISASNLANLAKEKIANGEDKSSFLSDPFTMIVFSTTSALTALFALGAIVLTTTIKKKRSFLKQLQQTTQTQPQVINSAF